MTSRKNTLEPEAPYESYEVYHLTNTRDRQIITDMLTGAEALNHVSDAILEYLLSPEPGQKRSPMQDRNR